MPPNMRNVLNNPNKIGMIKPTVRVEVDKLSYDPDMYTEIDIVKNVATNNVTAVIEGANTTPSETSILLNPIKGKTFSQCIVTSEFGAVRDINRDGAGDKPHTGIDLGEPTGVEIVAPVSGYVIWVETNSNTVSGKQILLDHGNGNITDYHHLSEISVSTDSGKNFVKQGQVIGKVGNTGTWTTGPHLHFGIRVNDKEPLVWSRDKYVDPRPYLEGSKSFFGITTKEPIGSTTMGKVMAKINTPLFTTPHPLSNKVAGYSEISEGTSLDLLKIEGDFYKVQVSSFEGYVWASDIKSAGMATVNKDTEARVYSFDNIGTVFRSILKDSIVEVKYTEGYNSICLYNGETVEIKSADLTTEAYTPTTLSKDEQIVYWAKYVAGKDYDYRFICAVAQHETQFGTAGAGRDSQGNFILGYGYFGDTNGDGQPEYIDSLKGIENQIKGFDKRFRQTMHGPNGFKITSQDDVIYFYKGEEWGSGKQYAGDTNWPYAVWPIYRDGILTNSSGGHSWLITGQQFNEYQSIDTTINVAQSISLGVPVYTENSASSTTLKILNNKDVVNVLKTTSSWTHIKCDDGTVGYVQTKFLNLSPDTLEEYTENQIFSNDFEAYSIDTRPNIFTYSGSGWKVGQDLISNVFTCKNLELYSKHLFGLTLKIANKGKLKFEYTSKMGGDNSFNVLVNNKIVKVIDGNTDTLTTAEVNLNSGSNNIQFQVIKSTEADCEVSIDNITITEYLNPDSSIQINDPNISESLSKKQVVSIDTETYLYDIASLLGDKLKTVNRGENFVYFTESTEFYKVYYGSGYAYVPKVHSSVNTREYMYGNYKTGGFKYERTLVLDNIISVDIDTKVGSRSSTATIVISNENGKYSPDYRPNKFPSMGYEKSPFVEYYNGKPISVLSDNTPIRIYLGYGDRPQRRFTGLIDNVTENGDSKTITIKCTDMMKKINNYCLYQDITYPPDDYLNSAWLVSAVIQDMAIRAGMNKWKYLYEDLLRPDMVIDESYYIDIKAKDGKSVVKMVDDKATIVDINSIPSEDGYLNPYLLINRTFQKGTLIGDNIEEQCQTIGYWQRCDVYGTYRASLIPYSFKDLQPVMTYSDDIVTISKTIDYSNTRNHIIVYDGSNESTFFDNDLWMAVKGERRTMGETYTWAKEYGQKKSLANKLFTDMKIASRTLQAGIEGNPYLELFDVIAVQCQDVQVRDNYIIKGIVDSYSDSGGYITKLDLFWVVED